MIYDTTIYLFNVFLIILLITSSIFITSLSIYFFIEYILKYIIISVINYMNRVREIDSGNK